MLTPLTSNLTIEVKVVSGAIKCGKYGGNLKVKAKKADDSPLKITWTNVDNPQQQFRLQFRERWGSQVGFWPFMETEPAEGLTAQAVSHTFTFANNDNECKYSVIVGSLVLDPIIIVEKRQ
jgi:hypothetical protein